MGGRGRSLRPGARRPPLPSPVSVRCRVCPRVPAQVVSGTCPRGAVTQVGPAPGKQESSGRHGRRGSGQDDSDVDPGPRVPPGLVEQYNQGQPTRRPTDTSTVSAPSRNLRPGPRVVGTPRDGSGHGCPLVDPTPSRVCGCPSPSPSRADRGSRVQGFTPVPGPRDKALPEFYPRG